MEIHPCHESLRDRIYRVGIEKGLRQGTILSYERLFTHLGLIDQQQATQEEVVQALWNIDNPNTRRAAVIAVRSVLGYQIKIPKGHPRRYVLPSEEQLRFALMLSPHEVRGLLMMYAGCRIGEACAITAKDLRGDQLLINKQVLEHHRTGQPTLISVGPVKGTEATITVPQVLSERLGDLSGRAKPGSVRESLRRAGTKAGISLTPHMLRKWYCTHLLSQNAPLELVRKQMRHSDISITLSHYQEYDSGDVHKYFGRSDDGGSRTDRGR